MPIVSMLNRRETALVLALLILSGVAEAQQTGTLSAVTGEGGSYQFTTLPPGTYVVNYELTGFAPLRREGIVVQVARTTRVDIELGVGTLHST